MSPNNSSWEGSLRSYLSVFSEKSTKYEPVDNANAQIEDGQQPTSSSSSSSPSSSTEASWTKSPWVRLGGALFAVWLFLIGLFRLSSMGQDFSSMPAIVPAASQPTYPIATSRSLYMHLMLPMIDENTSPDFCQTLFSSAALDYPTPRLINFQRPDARRIFGVRDYLTQLGDWAGDELMLIVAGTDGADGAWFQLRPSTVIERFYAMNVRANARLRQRLNINDASSEGGDISQRVVFSAAAQCGKGGAPEADGNFKIEGKELCYVAPGYEDGAPDLPIDGRRYLHPGVIIGYVKDLKPLYEAATFRLIDRPNDSEQVIFAYLFWQQERYRQAVAERNKNRNGDGSGNTIQAREGAFDTGSNPDDASRELGIGLDYGGEIAQPSSLSRLADDDREDEVMRYVTYSDGGDAGFTAAQLARDIAHATPPYWTADYTGDRARDGQLPAPGTPWADVPLLTNTLTRVTPAIALHAPRHRRHAGHLQPIKAHQPGAWRDLFTAPYLRALLETKPGAPRAPVAVLASGPHGAKTDFWGTIDERGGARVEIGSQPGDWRPWDDPAVCGNPDVVADAVLADGRGGWQNPVALLPWDNQDDAFRRWREMYGRPNYEDL
ncbi:hypothetical protein F4780DRAFT_734132 [Xylariomycetidae sp. FL0641]|nr:hypothetical protein F4780DRAFT_734132 [Xylariomycetidae sp. FL0641]